jgi:hypothetical protein
MALRPFQRLFRAIFCRALTKDHLVRRRLSYRRHHRSGSRMRRGTSLRIGGVIVTPIPAGSREARILTARPTGGVTSGGAAPLGRHVWRARLFHTFPDDALRVLSDVRRRSRPIFVGGTGLWLHGADRRAGRHAGHLVRSGGSCATARTWRFTPRLPNEIRKALQASTPATANDCCAFEMFEDPAPPFCRRFGKLVLMDWCPRNRSRFHGHCCESASTRAAPC